MTRPILSVLIDTYNHEQYIEQAVISAIEQDFPSSDYEILVVDDGSTDRTPEIVQKFAPRVRLLRKKNGGQASAFNAAFPESKGQIIAILDGDDWLAKEKLVTVVKTLSRHPEVSAVSHAYHRVYEDTGHQEIIGPAQTTLMHLETPESATEALNGWGFLVMGALTVRRTVLEKVIPIPETLVFSADSPIAAASMAMRTLILPQPLSYYRIHSGNLYAPRSKDDTDDERRVRRRHQMDAAMCRVLWPLLLQLKVPPECISALLEPIRTRSGRFMLRTFGGSRLETFRTEMRSFHSEFKNPSAAYRLFKYLVVGGATLLLPPKRFYAARDWYGRHRLGRVREWVFGKIPTRCA